MNPISFILWLAGLLVLLMLTIQHYKTPQPRKWYCLPLGLLLVWLALLLQFLIKTPHAVNFTWS